MTGPRKRWSSSYRLRLVIGFVVVVALFTGAWAWSLYGPLTDAIVEQQQEHLQGVAQAGALLISQTDRSLPQSVEQLVARTDLRVTVVAADGTVLADSAEDPATMTNHADRPEVAEALAGRIGTDTRMSATQGVEQLYVAVPASYSGESVALRVSESLASINEITRQARGTGLALLVVTLLLAAVFVWRLTEATAGPVERLAAVAGAMAAGNLSTPVPQETGTLEPLADSLTRLREQLRSRISDLEAEQRTLRLTLDGLDDAVLLLEGDVVQLANSAVSTMFRLPPVDIRNRKLDEIGLPASIAAALSTLLTSATAGTTDLGPDPYRRYHRVLSLPLGDGETGARTLAVIAETTERMRLDSMRRHFVANASHELKTPTAAILLLAESAEHAAEDGDAEQALAFVSQLQAEATRLRQLVVDLLDLSRLETAPPEDAVTDVRHAVELALAGHRRSAAEGGLELTGDFESVQGQDVVVRADPTDVAVALDNLLANAIAYTEHGHVTVRVSADEETVAIAVQDTGVGIPAKDVERVFERFYRVDRARTRASGGTGLGLALVRHVAERAGGSAVIESQEGCGTTATLTLRRAS